MHNIVCFKEWPVFALSYWLQEGVKLMQCGFKAYCFATPSQTPHNHVPSDHGQVQLLLSSVFTNRHPPNSCIYVARLQKHRNKSQSCWSSTEDHLKLCCYSVYDQILTVTQIPIITCISVLPCRLCFSVTLQLVCTRAFQCPTGEGDHGIKRPPLYSSIDLIKRPSPFHYRLHKVSLHLSIATASTTRSGTIEVAAISIK